MWLTGQKVAGTFGYHNTWTILQITWIKNYTYNYLIRRRVLIRSCVAMTNQSSKIITCPHHYSANLSVEPNVDGWNRWLINSYRMKYIVQCSNKMLVVYRNELLSLYFHYLLHKECNIRKLLCHIRISLWQLLAPLRKFIFSFW